MIKRLTNRIGNSDGIGIFHDTRGDVRTLAKMCNMLTDKVNELVNAVNYLEEENRKLKEQNKETEYSTEYQPTQNKLNHY